VVVVVVVVVVLDGDGDGDGDGEGDGRAPRDPTGERGASGPRIAELLQALFG